MKLTVETDDATAMKSLVVLADILISGGESDLFIFEIPHEIGFFTDRFCEYLGAGAFPEDALLDLIGSMQKVLNRLRSIEESHEAKDKELHEAHRIKAGIKP